MQSLGKDALQLLPGLFAFPGRFLWHADSRTAILADLHLGAEQSLAKAGLYLAEAAEIAHRQMIRAWDVMLQQKPARVIIAGDLFDSPAPGEKAQQLAHDLLRTLHEAEVREIIFTPGNHDPSPFAFREILGDGVVITDAWTREPLFISHGHEKPSESRCNIWVTGHQHPAVHMKSAVHDVKMPCFAVCTLGGPFPGRLVLLPAFSRMPLGCDLLRPHHWLMPVQRPGEDDIRIAGIIERRSSGGGGDARVLDFGPLAGLGQPLQTAAESVK